MTIDNACIVELNRAFRLAENLARKRSPKAWLILSFLIPRRRLKYLFLCYAYLREVDNLLDHENISIDEKKKFINGQLQLLTSLNNRIVFSPNSEIEAFLFYFLSYSIDNKKSNLVYELKNMLEALRMDVSRLEKGGIFSNDELSAYINLLNTAMFGLVHSFMFPNDIYDEKYYNLGTFLWYGGALRDILKDFEAGYINLSAEDIKTYQINISNIKTDENFKRWLEDKILYLFELLDKELSTLNALPIKIRLFWTLGYPFYLHKIIRIQKYNYSIDYETRKNIIKESNAFSSTLGLTFKIFQRVFITPKIEKSKFLSGSSSEP